MRAPALPGEICRADLANGTPLTHVVDAGQQTGVWKAIFEALSDDPDFEFLLIDETICLRPAKTLTGRDLRNSVIEQTIKQLEQLEHKFCDGDPVREAIAVARRTAATQLVVTATIGELRPKVVK